MRILYLTKYTRLGASSRLRSYQYFPLLEKEGFEICVSPLFDDAYVQGIFEGSKPKSAIIKGYAKRFFKLFTAGKYDLLVIEYELFPYFPAFFEYILYKLGRKYIVDYDDAIFHNYDMHPKSWVRTLLGNKIAKVMKYSSYVFAGNKYLANYAKDAGAKDVAIIPTVIDAQRYSQKNNEQKEKVVIGWIGSPSTFKYLEMLKPVFQELDTKYAFEIHIVGAKKSLGLPDLERNIVWSEDSEVAAILNFDIGVMPLEDTPWAKGKCSYKLIQYMACGIPVVASPVGMNTEVVTQDRNGFLATTAKEWEQAIEKLITSSVLRERMGKNGSNQVTERYTLQIQAPKLISIFKNARRA